MCPRQELNLDLELRRFSFYPLNYGDVQCVCGRYFYFDTNHPTGYNIFVRLAKNKLLLKPNPCIGMFKKNEPGDFTEAETIIGPSVKVEGDFVGEGNFVIDGIVKGRVQTAGNLKIGPRAIITASVQAANALIAGEVQGDVFIDSDLELTETAKITGDITTQSICVARGALLNGACTMQVSAQERATQKKSSSPQTAEPLPAE